MTRRVGLLLLLLASVVAALPGTAAEGRKILAVLGHLHTLTGAAERVRIALLQSPGLGEHREALGRAVTEELAGETLVKRVLERLEARMSSAQWQALGELARDEAVARHAGAWRRSAEEIADPHQIWNDPQRRRELVRRDPWKRELARWGWIEDASLALIDHLRHPPGGTRRVMAIPAGPSPRLRTEGSSLQKALGVTLSVPEMEAYAARIEAPAARALILPIERDVEQVLVDAMERVASRTAVTSGVTRVWERVPDGGDAAPGTAPAAIGAAGDARGSGPCHIGIQEAAFLAGPDRLATAGDDGVLRVWDTRSGDLVATLPDEPGRYGALAGDASGRRLAAGDEFGMVHLWDLASGKEIAETQPHHIPVSFVTFSPRGDRLLSADYYGTDVALWDLETSRIQRLPALGLCVRFAGDAVFSPDGTRIRFFDRDGWHTELDPATGELTRGEAQLGSPVARGYLLPEGQYLRTHPTEGVSLHQAPTGALVRKLEDSQGFAQNHNLLAANQSTFAAVTQFTRVRSWDLATGRPLPEATIPARIPAAIALSPDSSRIALSEGARTLLLEKGAGGRFGEEEKGAGGRFGEGPLPPGGMADVQEVVKSPSGSGWAVRGILGAISFWDGSSPLGPAVTEATTCAAFSPDGRVLACGMDLHHAGDIHLFEVPSARRLEILRAHEAPVTAVAFDPAGRGLASVDRSGRLVFWSLDPPRVAWEARDAAGALTAVSFSPDGGELTAEGVSGQVLRWRLSPPATGASPVPERQ